MATQAALIQQNDPTLYNMCYANPPPAGSPTQLICRDQVASKLRQLCDQSSIYVNSTFCQGYCAGDMKACPTIAAGIGPYCNTTDGLNTDYCKNWCLQNPGYCNDSMRTYCDANPTKDICACLKSPQLAITGLIPECHDSKCRNYGYKAYTPTSCPDYISCNTALQIGDTIGNINLTGVTIEQNCGQQTGSGSATTDVNIPPSGGVTDGGATNGTTAATNNATGAAANATGGMSITMIIIIVVGFILLIIAGIVLYYNTSPTTVEIL